MVTSAEAINLGKFYPRATFGKKPPKKDGIWEKFEERFPRGAHAIVGGIIFINRKLAEHEFAREDMESKLGQKMKEVVVFIASHFPTTKALK